MEKICTICGESKSLDSFYKNPITKDKRGSQCKPCDTRLARERGFKKKEILVKALGGKCQICGYDKNVAALDFHHKDENKEFEIGQNIRLSIEKLLEEAQKCTLLCCRCHREVHNPKIL